MSNIQTYLNNILKAIYGKDVRQSIHDAIREIDSVADTAQNSASASALAAKASETAAKTSETNTKASETATKASEIAAKTSETNAKASETATKASEIAAKTSETNAANSATSASNSATTATSKASEAATSATNAATSATTATQKATAASTSETNAANSATSAETYAKQAQSYAVGTGGVRPNESSDNAKKYYEQAKAISESFSGALRPMGTVAFTNLPGLISASAGDMYNVSDQFTTTADFKEGEGNVIPAGANVYKTVDGKWDVLAGSPVTTVNGQSGNVSITASGIGAISETGGEMTGEFDIDMGYGEVKIFGDNRGAHVWLHDIINKYHLQIVCEEATGMMYLVSNVDTNPTCMHWVQIAENAFNVQRSIAVGLGAENGRIYFHSPSSLRDSWIGTANDNGNMYWWDTTANKAIISAPKGGTPAFHGHATSDLALTGGTITGHLILGTTGMSDSPNLQWQDKNHIVWAGMENGNGDWYLFDTTNQIPIIICNKSGAVTYRGGTMKTNLQMGDTSMSNSPDIWWVDKFRKIWAGMCNGAGDWYLYDATNSKSIIQSVKSGYTTFYGNALNIYNGSAIVCSVSADANTAAINSTGRTLRMLANIDGAYIGLDFGKNTAAQFIIPSAAMDGVINLGYSGIRFKQLWATNTTVTTSDRNYKEEIEYLTDDYAKDIIMHLKPASFKFKNKEGDIVTHDRRHFGFIAQDIEDDIVDGLGMPSSDLGFFIKSPTKDIPDYEGDLDYIYSLRYEEFISVAVKAIQAQQNEIENQQKKIADLERRLEALES